MKNLIVFFLFAFNLTPCLSLSIPKQINSPTTLGNNVAVLEIEQLTIKENKGFIGFDFGIGYGVTDKMDIDIDLEITRSDSKMDYISLGVQYQWLGASAFKTTENNWNSTTQLKFILGDANNSSKEVAGNRIKAPGFSLSNSFGYMIQDWVSVYGGGQAVYLFVDKINNHIWGYGPFSGIQLNISVSSVWKVILAIEGNLLNIPDSSSVLNKEEKRHWTPGFFGSLSLLHQF